MSPRRRSPFRVITDDTVVCHRMGYSTLTPQACLEKHVRNEEACYPCRQFDYSASMMMSLMDCDSDVVLERARNSELTRYSNPLIRPESLPEIDVPIDREKGDQEVNTYILFINGRRMPSGIASEFRRAGGMAERYLIVLFLASFLRDNKIEIKDIAVDEYNGGRLVTRYEWGAADKDRFGPKLESKVKKAGKDEPAIGFRMQPQKLDDYSR